ncbi:LysR substrate-binding domain-containing protein [Pseudomonas sp. NA-150]|uniref:LysR substrate-binding domain-containing protein n=1 Tax=Pseudomonas sp. NA-150 TaxID=3367525 RepID=UPI0037C9F273
MNRLPPLNAVKAFEVTARVGSFVLAAAELGVTSAAVSQQVRHLEDFLGRQLFVRTGNRLTLTDAGHGVYTQTARALGDLANMTTRMLEGDLHARRLVVSVPYSLAENWLAPKLSGLLDFYPQLSIDIRVEDDPVDLARSDIDLRIAYGDYHYPGLTGTLLVQDQVLPMCAPDFWYRHGNQEFNLVPVQQNLFIHTHWGVNYASHPTWGDWFNEAGSRYRPDPTQGRRSGLSSLSISMARLGLGIALGQKTVAHSDLEAGRLIILSPVALRLGHAYYAFVPVAKAARADIKRLVTMLEGDT